MSCNLSRLHSSYDLRYLHYTFLQLFFYITLSTILTYFSTILATYFHIVPNHVWLCQSIIGYWDIIWSRYTLKLKRKLYWMTIRLALLNGSKCKAFKKNHSRKMGVANKWILQWMSGHNTRDRFRNKDIKRD